MNSGSGKYQVIMRILEIIENDVPTKNADGLDELAKMAEIASRLQGRIIVQSGGKVEMGDKFENIQNSNIINRSQVADAMKSVSAAQGADVSNALAEVATAVEESGNAAAGALLDNFTAELGKPEPDKSALKQCWDGLKAVLPDVAAIASASEKIAKLFL